MVQQHQYSMAENALAMSITLLGFVDTSGVDATEKDEFEYTSKKINTTYEMLLQQFNDQKSAVTNSLHTNNIK